MSNSDESGTDRIRNAPRGFFGTLAALGPGLVVIGSVMGSGELINTPHQAAKFGFVLLWAVILSCVIKYFLQIEIGRFTLAHQCTPFEAFSTLPFPKFRGTSWIGLLYMGVSLPTSLAFAGMIGATAGMMHSLVPLSASVETSNTIWIWILAMFTWGILWRGVYAEMEKLVMVLVLGFSVSVVVAMFLIQGTEFHISMSDLTKGMTFSLGEDGRLAAFAVISLMGALGATANELFMYPYWILEKGYTEFTGPPESDGWQQRTRGWIRIIQIDVGVSTFLTTIITAAYFLMGAAVLHSQGIEVTGTGVVDELSRMFTDSYGPWSRGMFLIGAFCTLFSTLIVGIAAFARMWGDMFTCLGTIAKDDAQGVRKCQRLAEAGYMIMIPVIATYGESISRSLFGTDKIGPATLVIAGQYVSGLFCTPLLIFAICWLAFRTDKRVRMGRTSAICLVVSVITITACILISTLMNLLGGTSAPAVPPSPPIEVGLNTTYFLEPIDEDGYVDYAAAINRISSEGIAPEDNAYALLWSVWGPQAGRSKHTHLASPLQVAKQVCDSLSIPVPPDDGTSLISLDAFIRSLPPNEQLIAFTHPDFQGEKDIKSRISKLYDILDGPWSASDHPIIRQWLKRNRKPLDIAVKASQRTGFYAPLYFPKADWTWASREISSVLVPIRDIARALGYRSQARVREGQLDGAWEDVIASIRLSRLISQSPEFISLLNGSGIQAISMDCR